jgi:hypothetical protein
MKAARDVMLKHRLLLVTTVGSSGLEAAKPCAKASPLFYGSRGSRIGSLLAPAKAHLGSGSLSRIDSPLASCRFSPVVVFRSRKETGSLAGYL